jgi:transcriptional regulator with XRE-family HTH domain
MAYKSELLRAKLKEVGRTQSFLAELTGVQVRTVSRWLNGKNPPKSSDLEKIAKALGCTPQDFDPSFADESQGKVAIHAHVSVAAHNAYELMKMRYGATQKDILELAPVLFSIVAAYALRVPDQDETLHHEATRRGLTSPLDKSYEFANGFGIDQQASKSKKCFGLPANDPTEAETRNLFYEAILRLCLDLDETVNPEHLVKPEPGRAPSSAGFIPDVDMLTSITGGDAELIEALTKGRIRLSTCLEYYKKCEGRNVETFIDVLRQELERTDDQYQKQIAEKREEGQVKLKAWRTFYKERHPLFAQEYDQIVEAHCHEDGWYPSYYDENLKELCWVEPYREDRHINDETLPEYQAKEAEFPKMMHLPMTDPIYQRFQQLQAHRRKAKADFKEGVQ